MTISPAWEGALRTLGLLLLMTVLSWASQSANIQPLLGVIGSGIVTMLAGSLENFIKSETGSALFGAVKSR